MYVFNLVSLNTAIALWSSVHGKCMELTISFKRISVN